MTGEIATWNYISLQIICNWKQHPAPVWALLLTSSTANSSKIHWASCNAGAVSVMLGASELIIPSGRVNSSVVESLKKTDTNSELNMLFHEVSRVLRSSTSVLFLCCCFDFFWSGNGAQSSICIHILLSVKEIKGGLLQTSVPGNLSTDFWPFNVQSVKQCLF